MLRLLVLTPSLVDSDHRLSNKKGLDIGGLECGPEPALGWASRA